MNRLPATPARDPSANQPEGRRSSRLGPGRLTWLAALVLVSTSWLAFEWIRAPNGTLLLGPLYFAWYGFPIGWLFALVLFPCLLAYTAKPNAATAAISGAALVLWLVLGELGQAIGC